MLKDSEGLGGQIPHFRCPVVALCLASPGHLTQTHPLSGLYHRVQDGIPTIHN